MKDIVTCYVRTKTGAKPKKVKCVNGEAFDGPGNIPYNAPKADNYEILEDTNWLGNRRRLAFYVEGEANAIPLSKNGTWKSTAAKEKDIDILVKVTAEALKESNLADMKANLSLIGEGVLLLALIIHHMAG